jgi:hypothetical protein
MDKSTNEIVTENWATIAPELGLDGTDPPEAFRDGCFESGPGEWRVATDEEADACAREYVKDSLWAFRPSFLSSVTGLDEKIFNAFVKADLCEDANEAVEALVEHTCGLDKLVEDAVTADGRGHFLSSYDGEEREIVVDGTYLYFYRIN